MSLPFSISGAQTVIPGVYDSFRVASSIPAPAPAGRSILLLGEAEEGVPGNLLDLKLNFYTDFQSVKDFYKSGPIVDAARMIFSNQPSPVFAGAVQRLYIYKTNESTRAEKAISSPANYGKLVAARYGEAGNQIKTQIKTGQAESKPSKTLNYLASPVSRSFRAYVNGTQSAAQTVAAGGQADAFVTALGAISGLSATGGTARTVNTAAVTVDITASGDLLTITKTGGAGDFGTSTQVGDSAYIVDTTAIGGGSDENAGSYIVSAWSATTVTLKHMKRHTASGETNAVAFSTGTGLTLAVGDLKANAPVTISVTATTATGSAATLEFLGDTANKFALANAARPGDLASPINDANAALASISASVPSAGQLTVSLTNGSFTSIPKAGDLVKIGRGSLIAGATLKNVGLLGVVSASAQSITLTHLYSGMTTEAVSSTTLSGDTSALTVASGFVSSTLAAKRIDSAAERKAQLDASRTSDGAALPSTLIGGNIALELSYYAAGATAATVSINALRQMTITPTGAGTTITVNMNKYPTLQGLVDYLNTQANVSARIPDNRNKSLSTKTLDAVSSVGILSAHSIPDYNGRLKKDYSDWKQYFSDNFSLLAFSEGTMALKAGLPDAEAAASFLSGAAVGSTANAGIQTGLDEGLKVDVRLVLPLFSRDAQHDISDGNTDSSSAYTIDSVNAAVKAHCATASGTLFKKERFGMLSYDGSQEDALQKVGEIGYERCQMAFQRVTATAADGSATTFLPWMAAAAAAAARVQAPLATSLLRKPFLLSKVSHVGQMSLYTDTLTQDFDPDDRGELEAAIAAGLMVFRAVSGFGIRLESPDLSTRSRNNDPEGWVWERVNVLFTCDEVRQTIRNVLDNFIGNRTSDTPTAVVKTAIENVIASYISSGALLSGSVTKIQSLGNQYIADVKITPAEAIEAIVLTVTAERSTT